jgi:hypothetical protein
MMRPGPHSEGRGSALRMLSLMLLGPLPTTGLLQSTPKDIVVALLLQRLAQANAVVVSAGQLRLSF